MLDHVHRGFVRIDPNAPALHEVERPHVVQAQHVVGMSVRIEDGVDAIHAGAQGLLPEVRRRIDHNAPPAPAHQDGWPQALIARICGSANGAAATFPCSLHSA